MSNSFKPAYTSSLNPPCSRDQLRTFVDHDESSSARTLFVGNMSPQVHRKLLYELMIQVGPVESIRIVPPRSPGASTFAFVLFEHATSVRYAMLVFKNLPLFQQQLSLNFSGEHKNKPRPDYPPMTPTFFEVPLGLKGKLCSEASKNMATQTQAVPPPSYNSGYYILDLETSPESSYCRKDDRSLESPEPKRGSWEPAGNLVPLFSGSRGPQEQSTYVYEGYYAPRSYEGPRNHQILDPHMVGHHQRPVENEGFSGGIHRSQLHSQQDIPQYHLQPQYGYHEPPNRSESVNRSIQDQLHQHQQQNYGQQPYQGVNYYGRRC